MDQLNSEVEVLSTLPLDQLCSGALHELLIRGYSRRMVNRYTLVWQHLAEFARKQNLAMRTRGAWRCASRKSMAFARASASSQPRDGAGILYSVLEFSTTMRALEASCVSLSRGAGCVSPRRCKSRCTTTNSLRRSGGTFACRPCKRECMQSQCSSISCDQGA